MKEDASGRRQRAVMATDAEWERIGRAAAESGMDLSRFVIHRALDWDPLPAEVLRRAVREMLVLARLEERRLRGLCCKPDVGVSQIRTTSVLSSCFCVGQTVL